ncbi:MAG: hypothetical protein WCO53_14215 [Deltaproteobacteria bacterium]
MLVELSRLWRDKAFDLTLLPSNVNISNMNTLETSLDKIAENILYLDEASLTSLWDKYKSRMEQFSYSPEWEKSVIIFSIINSIRVKNAIFNEQLLSKVSKEAKPAKQKQGKPYLKLVK